MQADKRFFPYFDIPFQSGDADTIARMNRKGSPDAYRSLVRDIRSAFASGPYGTAALRTTFLVGFPGESDESFACTARFLADIRSLWSGAFTWSCEEGTPAAGMKKRVPKKTARSRLEALQTLQIGITPEELRFFVGKSVEVLVEELIPEPENGAPEQDGSPASRLALGRTWFQAPEVDGSVVLQYEDSDRDSNGNPVSPGSVVSAVIMAVNGVDVEAVVR